MDIFERFQSRLGVWYDNLLGRHEDMLRPKDVLDEIIAVMEDGRTEGLDGSVYVPNQYVLELAVADAGERETLLSFLEEDELAEILQQFMAENGYRTRGPLRFVIAEVPSTMRSPRTETLRIQGKFEKGEAGPRPANDEEDDLPTVAALDTSEDEEPGTVPAVVWASLTVTNPEGVESRFPLTQPMVQIGRSRRACNDLVLDADGQVSKAHARLERERDGQWTLYDLSSTNGVTVNASPVNGNRTLADGDEIGLGETRLVFQKNAPRLVPASVLVPVPSSAPPRRARLIGPDGEVFVLASETLIGCAVTGDIILPDPSVATRHARIAATDAAYFLEDLAGQSATYLNGRILFPGQRLPLANGDTLTFGTIEMRFIAGNPMA